MEKRLSTMKILDIGSDGLTLKWWSRTTRLTKNSNVADIASISFSFEDFDAFFSFEAFDVAPDPEFSLKRDAGARKQNLLRQCRQKKLEEKEQKPKMLFNAALSPKKSPRTK
ncbi:hypothetical protein Bhyg_16726 [Pseudolycoriella hygida]|uniref:Uncharacterized protein n=1 Tax=Pseudolycoriella hygida TaxID=35572 RepID=A0A9Q0RU52_9DIPT|nr:hypothetical protein Bhyg_16726 [Pseudolycoriella hygida]